MGGGNTLGEGVGEKAEKAFRKIRKWHARFVFLFLSLHALVLSRFFSREKAKHNRRREIEVLLPFSSLPPLVVYHTMSTGDLDGIPDMRRVWTMDLMELTMESKPFARGAFGHVFKGEYYGTPVCVKILKNEDPNERASSFKLIQREVTSLKFGHPNLVQFMGAAENGDEIYIITEYIHGGNLRQYIKVSNDLDVIV